MAATAINIDWGSASNRDKWTYSAWVKRSKLGADQVFFSCYQDANNYDAINFHSNDGIDFYSYQSSSYAARLLTNRRFKDTNGWYHVVCSYDSGNSTANDRMKMWINGVEETSFQVRTNPSQNADGLVQSANNHFIGKLGTATAYYDGYISHVHFCDGYAYAASDFGEADSNGVWKIKTSPSVSYGTKGFFILKDGNSLTDQSPNSNNWTANTGTLTNDKDNPSNVFATMNPLDNHFQGSTFSNGNNTVVSGSSSVTYNTSTLMMNSGKFYCEVKPTTGSATSHIGITGQMSAAATENLSSRTYGWAYIDSGSVYNNNSSLSGSWGSYANNDIIGIAVDLDNNKLYFSKNGTWQNSGDPTSGSTGTGALSLTAPSSTPIGAYAFAMNETWNDNTRTWQWNFGNGYFGTTAVSSAGTNASGNGVFEYNVPAGYTALCTKGLNS